MIKLTNINKTYGKKRVLKDVNLKVDKGEMIAIMGQSGAGKTTLLNILGFLDEFDNGTYVLDGIDTSTASSIKKNEYRSSKVNYILQNYGLVNSYTVYENMEIPLEVRKVRKKDRKEIIIENLKKLNIEELIHEKVTNLSGGEKQRVAISRCLINDANLLLADEPTGNLDASNGQKVIDTLRKINKEDEKTIIIVTHSMDVARQCDKIYNIIEGTLDEL